MPSATGTLRAQLYMNGRGNIDFDGGVLTPNMLTDGGFEGGAQGWQRLGPAGATINLTTYANAGAHDGNRYAESNTSVDGGSIYQDVPVSLGQGASATFSIWARLAPGVTAQGQNVDLCLWALTGSPTNACATRHLNNDWQQIQATATMPSATGTLRAQLYMNGRGNIDFDGASLGAPQTADAVYPPVATAVPAVSGSTIVGSTLTCSMGSWTNAPIAFAYGWRRDASPIPAATRPTYAITQADLGHRISCLVMAANDGGVGTAASAAVGPVTAPVVSKPVTVAVPTPAPKRHRRQVRTKIVLSWTWNRTTTRLTQIRVPHFPRSGTITVACHGRGCPRRRRRADARHLRRMFAALRGTRYRAGDRVVIEIDVRGEQPERALVQIRDGAVPTARLL
jgi:hypothetical protein